MKIAIIGGTGSLGGHAAVHLSKKGHDVTVVSRTPPGAATPMAAFPFLKGDYVKGDIAADMLQGFDAIIFAAGNDGRHIPDGMDAQAHLDRANVEAVPAFARIARQAGVKRFILLGSYYPQAAPELEESNGYIRSRRLADEGARAEGRPGFDVISVNAPFMVGAVPGRSDHFDYYVDWATGKLQLPLTAPAGGTNFMSYHSLSQALEGALLRGEPGKAYLVGDENLTYAEFFQLFFEAAGKPVVLETKDEEFALLPDAAIFQGRGNWVRVHADDEEVALLSYDRHDIKRAVTEIIELHGATHALTN